MRRERLHALLTDSIEYDVTVIGTPAGFGKSTLAVDWCAESVLPAIWLSLDRGDWDPLALIADLVGAVRQRFPVALDDLSQRLMAGAAPNSAAALVAELATTIQTDVDELAVLIVDGLHILDDAPAALDVIDTLIRNVPMNLRVILLSRTFPTLPSLDRLQNAVAQIGEIPALPDPDQARTGGVTLGRISGAFAEARLAAAAVLAAVEVQRRRAMV